jgi:cytochrome c-type biogenesis protein CcmE
MTGESVVIRIPVPSGARVILRAYAIFRGGTMENTIASRSARPASRSRIGAVRFFAGGLVILAVIGYVTFSSFQSNAVYYYTLREFKAQQSKLGGQTLRINGPLDKESIQTDQKTLVLQFNLKDGDLVQPVVYRGVAPDTLKTGESVVAEGHLGTDGVFQADNILVKCPSKYEEQKTTQ